MEFEKTFDSIQYRFIFAILESFGFELQLIQWFRTLLKNAKSCVMNNDHSTGCISLKGGMNEAK